MADYVLIHGAFHGGWCWRRVTPLLEAAGHTAIAPDLPGHRAGESPRALNDAPLPGRASEALRPVTLEDYVEAVVGHLRRCAAPAVLVGHSMAGVVIAQAAERAPELIRRLVFVTAYLPVDGQSLDDLLRADPESLVRVMRGGADGFVAIRPDALVPAFYGDATEDDVAFVRKRLVAQAIPPMKTPVRLSAERFGRVPRTYIGCRRDRAITHALQTRMRTATPCERIIDLDCDHAPFFSAPRALAAALLAE